MAVPCKVTLQGPDPDISDLAQAAQRTFIIALGNVDLSEIQVYEDEPCSLACDAWEPVKKFAAGKEGRKPFYIKAQPPASGTLVMNSPFSCTRMLHGFSGCMLACCEHVAFLFMLFNHFNKQSNPVCVCQNFTQVLCCSLQQAVDVNLLI